MDKPLIFISHITEEKQAAVALKTFIEESFLGAAEVFVSSDGDSIGAGDKWVDKISEALKTCVCEIILCSRISIGRPWISFEAGAGWVRDIRVIPLCYAGLPIEHLPVPLKNLHAIDLSTLEGTKSLIASIARVIHLNTPKHGYEEFFSKIDTIQLNYFYWDVLNDEFRKIKKIVPNIREILCQAAESKEVRKEEILEIHLAAFLECVEGVMRHFRLFSASPGDGVTMYKGNFSTSISIAFSIPDVAQFKMLTTSPKFTEWMK